MNARALVVAVACSGAVVAAVNCTGRQKDCAQDSDCPQGGYCHPELKFCFARAVQQEDGGPDAEGDSGPSGTGDASLDASTDASVDGGGDAGPPLQPAFCTASHWCWETPKPTGASFLAAHGTSGSDVWVAGNGGLMHFDGQIWKDYSTTAPGYIEPMNGVWAANPTRAWAVGNSGLMKRWDGSSWQLVTTGKANDLYDAYGFTESDLWVIGSGGLILHWNGTSWLPEDSGTTAALYHLAGTNGDDLWAVGENGTILHRTAAGWSTVASTVSTRIFSICVNSSSDAWASVENGQIIHWNGSAWSVQSTAPTNLFALACRSSSDVWAAGESTLFHWNGITWKEQSGLMRTRFTDLAFFDDGSGWAVGTGGALLRWDGQQWQQKTEMLFTADVASLERLDDQTILYGLSDGRVLTCSNSGTCFSQFASDAGAVSALVSIGEPPYARVYAAAGDTMLLKDLSNTGPWLTTQLETTITALDGYRDDGGVETVWAVGANGLVATCGQSGCPLRSDAGSLDTLNAVVAQSGSALVAGFVGLLECSPGAACTPVSLPEQLYVHNLWSPDGQDVWAACSGGKIAVRQAGTWSVTQLSTSRDLAAVHGTGRNDIWVTTLLGDIFHFNGQDWIPMASGTDEALRFVRALSPDSAIVSTKSSGVHRFAP